LFKDADGNPVENIADLAGLSRERKVLALCFAMIMFSLAGIPPLFGFWGKLMVFTAAVHAGLFWFAVVVVLASVVGAFYYLKVIKVMYFDEPAGLATGKSDWVHQALLLLSAIAVSPLAWLASRQLATWAEAAAAVLFHAA
jgi:NADH-quinone oxidoreductase subunit N